MFKKILKSNFIPTRMLTGILFSLLTFFIGFPASATQPTQPGRTLVIHNNTNATLHVSNASIGIVEKGALKTSHPYHIIPPTSPKSLFNFLRRGRNEVHIKAMLIKNTRTLIKTFWVSGTERKSHEIEIFPRDFGKTVMFDPRWPDISGEWRTEVRGGLSYNIKQEGNKFTWLMSKFDETASGEFTDHSTITVKWKGGQGQGSATGYLTLNEAGRATLISWNNGVKWHR